MNRSIGITVIAVLAMLGSLLTLLMGILVAISMALAPLPMSESGSYPGSPAALKAILLLSSLMYVGPAIWGIFTSIGLFRLRNWARISMIVFSVLLLLVSLFGGLGAFMVSTFTPPPAAMDPAVMMAVRVVFGIIWAVLLSIGTWWLIFFNRAKVKQQFVPRTIALSATPHVAAAGNAGEIPTAAVVTQVKPQRPLSFTVLAWLMLVTCLFVSLSLALHAPAMLFTKIITGWPASLYYVLITAANICIGAGLLRFKAFARPAGIAYFVFMFVNSAVFYAAPGSRDRLHALMESQRALIPGMGNWPGATPPFDMTPFLYVGACMGLCFLFVPLYFLVTRKGAFEAAVAAR